MPIAGEMTMKQDLETNERMEELSETKRSQPAGDEISQPSILSRGDALRQEEEETELRQRI